EANLFFGREREARQLLARVISERLVLFYAQSGAGKSSLIHTRLIPQLEAADFTVLPVGRVSGELPAGVAAVDNIYAFNLRLSLDQSQRDPNRLSHLPLSDFLARLTMSADGQRWYYDETAGQEPAGAGDNESPYVLIIDQFEEIITTHVAYWSQREDFFRQLDRAMAVEPLLWVVLTLREDYVAALEPYAPLLADRLRARFYMERMSVDAALQAITRPAKLGDRPFAPGVAETLVDNLRQVHIPGQTGTHPGQYVEPVQLQVVCYKLWDSLKSRPANPISAADLQAAGDVDTALAEFYEQVVETTVAQTGVPEITLRRWFGQQLITEAGSRGTVNQGEQHTAGLPNRTVELLANQYLLHAEIRSGGIWYELVHDRFVEPIVQANRAWDERRLARNPLAKARQTWLAGGRSPAKLLRGAALKEAKAYAEAYPADTTADERQFLEESSQRLNPLATVVQLWLEGERKPDLLLRGRQLTEARAFAADNPGDLAADELEFLRASERQVELEQEQAVQAARRRRYAVITASVIIIWLAALLIWAIRNETVARREQAIAEVAQKTAVAAQRAAESDRAAANAARATAEAREAEAVFARATAYARATEVKVAEIQANKVAKALADSLAALLPTEMPPTPTPTPIIALLPTPTPPPLLPTPTSTPTPTATADQTATVQIAQTRLAEVRATETAAPRPVSPSGKLVFISNRFSNDKSVGHLFTMNADGSDLRQLTRDIASEPNYSAIADKIIYSKPQFGNIVALFTIRPNGAEEQGIDEQFWDNWEPVFAPDGLRLAFNSSRENRDWEIYSRNLDGSDLRWLNCGSNAPAEFPELLKWAPAWSPDGKKIAFVVSAERSQYAGQASIWVMDAAGANCQPLTGLPGAVDKYPDWSPDGRQIVFVSNRNGAFELFIMDAEGRNQRQAPTPAKFPQHINYPAWSPDGNWFTFSASTTPGDSTPDDIFVMTIAGQHLTNLTNGAPGQNENWYSDWIED
ncbi:MAG: hypothetical protein AB1801_12770, partial [Chloroflexota bacterium]